MRNLIGTNFYETRSEIPRGASIAHSAVRETRSDNNNKQTRKLKSRHICLVCGENCSPLIFISLKDFHHLFHSLWSEIIIISI
jgi:hypothetical protein